MKTMLTAALLALIILLSAGMTFPGLSSTEQAPVPSNPTAPDDFKPVSVRAFFHLEDVDSANVVITAAENSCEEGPIEIPVTQEDRRWVLDMLENGIITHKANDMCVTGGTTSYLFHTPDGEYLGCIELFEGLAVSVDGMYAWTLADDF